MPQVDLQNPVSACSNDGKIDCADDDPSENDVDIAVVNVDPDLPPDSFWLSKDSEYDWFDRTAFYYERKDSTKGNSTSSNPNINPNSNSNSQRFSVNLKSKAAIIGLPKTQKTTYVDSRRRSCKPANVKLFPKRPEPVLKSTISMAEPGSPKVSCMGRVRSKRCRRRSNSLKMKEKSADKQKAGIYSKVMSMFRSKKGRKKPSRSGSRRVAEEESVVERRWESASSKGKEIPVGGDQTSAEAPSLGAVKRFTSGRRSGSWTDDDFNQTISVSLDRRV